MPRGAVELIRTVFSVIFALLLFSSSVRLTADFGILGITTLYVSLLLMILAILFRQKIELKVNELTLFLMFFFLLFGAIAALFNQDISLLFKVLVFIALYVSTGIVIPSIYKENTEKVIMRLILITHIPMLFIPILLEGINHIPYYGVFDNTNSLGGVLVTVLVGFAALLFKNLEEIALYKTKSLWKSVLLNFAVIFSLILVVTFTTSRTSFLTSLLILLCGVALLVITAIKNKKLGNLILRFLKIAPIMVLLYFILNLFYPLKESIVNNVVAKFERKSGDVLDGRGDIWSGALKESGFFGGGSDVFSNNIGVGSHNTFITVIGLYGWIPAIAIAIFFATGLYYSFKYFLNSQSKYKYFPILMLITFLAFSMVEDMFYKLSMITTLSLIGLTMNHKKVIITK